jgi:hypothetical protein
MKKYITLIIVLTAILFSSCEDIIEVKLSDELVDLYAIQANITTKSNPYVYLYKSQRVNSDESYTGVSGATVSIHDVAQPANQIILTEGRGKAGFYTVEPGSRFLGETGKEYVISIETDNTTITGSDFLAPVESIDSIQVRSSLRGDNRFLGIFTYGPEPIGQGDYYKWDIYINNRLLSGAQNLVIASDELVDGNYVESFEIFTDFHDPYNPVERVINLGDTIMVRQNSISAFAYQFYFQMLNQSQTGGFFSVPPANIESNFTSSDGKPVLGLFTANDVSASNRVVIDQAIEDQLRD